MRGVTWRRVCGVAGLVAAPLRPVTCQSGGLEVFAPGVVSVEGENLYRGSFSPDGESFYFFRKLPGDAEDYRIWVTHRVGPAWGPAERVMLGGEHSDLYPTISSDGRRMVFSSYRPVPNYPEPQANLWIVERQGSVWAEPTYLEALSDPEAYNPAPLWEADGRLRYKEITWGAEGRRLHLVASPRGRGFQAGQRDSAFVWDDWRPGFFIWDAIWSPDGSIVVLGVSTIDSESGRYLPPDLWVSVRDVGGWTEPRPIDGVNHPDATENFPVFTPDGSELLFVRDFRTYYRVPEEGLR